SAYLRGIGFSTPGFENLEAWLTKQEGDRTKAPRCKIVDSPLGRGTSRTTRMAAHCAEQAAPHARLHLATTSSVFESMFGEIDIAVEQLDMMLEGDGVVSPAMLKNSVHNTGAGILSIAAKNRGFTTALAAGPGVVGATLLEAMTVLHTGLAAQVVAAVAD